MSGSVAEIIERARSLAPWHFDIELTNGIRTNDFNLANYGDGDLEGVGVVDPLEMKGLLQTIVPGRTFLDVACNSGGYCFLAHELGAKLCLGFDVRQRWIDQAKLIKSLKYPDVASLEFCVQNVQDFSPRQRFDVTLFKGIFYHLPMPIFTLKSICDLTERAIIVDTSSQSNIPEPCMIRWTESKTHVMSGVDGLMWLPSGPETLRPILAWAGFPHMRVVLHIKGTHAERFKGRFRILAARAESDLMAYDRTQPA